MQLTETKEEVVQLPEAVESLKVEKVKEVPVRFTGSLFDLIALYTKLISDLLGQKMVIEHIAAENYNKILIKKSDDTGYQEAEFSTYVFPNCCGICIISNIQVYSVAFRNKGLATLLSRFGEDLAYNLGYTMAVATDMLKNDYTQKIFDKEGWTKSLRFVNNRTKNDVELRYKLIRE